MTEPKVIDKRNEPKPERPKFHVYPTCRTCRYFENFVDGNGQVTGQTICVYDPPTTHAQIRGQDEEGNILWSSWHGWPAVFPTQRCGKHVAKDAN